MKNFVIVLASLISASALAQSAGPLNSALWSIQSPPGTVRWIEIHNLDSAARDGLFHLEVLERGASDPVWKIRHVCSHLAVTESALRASVLKPLSRGSVYPETYQSALARWKRDQSEGRAAICKSTIAMCMQGAGNCR